jgi:2-methylisocitrate lyase-like PEP mutase family enzyme
MTAPNRTAISQKAERLRALHVPGNPVVMPNAWDAASAKTLAAAAFAALATSSGAVAESLGYSDGENTPPDEMFAAIGRIARSIDVPLTADIERGYGLEPTDIVDRLIAAGAVGCNLEDSSAATGELVGASEQASWLSEVRAAATRAGVPLVLNARVDVHLRKWGEPDDRLDEAVRRALLYLEAGADCVYPIFLNEPAELTRFVEQVGGPVNVVFLPGGMSLKDMAGCGVARVTYGSGLAQANAAWLADAARKIAAGDSPY